MDENVGNPSVGDMTYSNVVIVSEVDGSVTDTVYSYSDLQNISEATDATVQDILLIVDRPADNIPVESEEIVSSVESLIPAKRSILEAMVDEGDADTEIFPPTKQSRKEVPSEPVSVTEKQTEVREEPDTEPESLEIEPLNRDEEQLYQLLREILPTDYEHVVLQVKTCSVDHSITPSVDPAGMFRATIRINLRTKEEALKWLEQFKASSLLDFTVLNSYKNYTQKIIFKKGYSCYLNTHPRRIWKTHHNKHMKCPGNLIITVRNFEMKESTDMYLKTHPAEVQIHHCHNHPIVASDALRHRRPSPLLEKIFNDLFASGHSPSFALRVHKNNLQLQYPNDYLKYWADGSYCPKLQWCYHQFYKFCRRPRDGPQQEQPYEILVSTVDRYNKDMDSVCAKLYREGDEVLLALCTPFMKRIHKLECSGEVAFVSTEAHVNPAVRILLMVTYTVCGDLPLGLVIFNSDVSSMEKGLKVLQTILPRTAFCGRGILGPVTILTDDCSTLRNSLKKVFHLAYLQTCKFHTLQELWDFIWDPNYRIKEVDERRILFQIFKNLINQETEEEFEEACQSALVDETLVKYQKMLKCLQELISHAGEWAMCYRSGNYVETKCHTLKDIIMKRSKGYTFYQFFDFFVNVFNSFFETRISDVLNHGVTYYAKSKYFCAPSQLQHLECEISEKYPHQYDVVNTVTNKRFVVDMEVESCSCPTARGGVTCKHICKVVQKYVLFPHSVLPLSDKDMKDRLHFVLTGSLDSVPDFEIENIRVIRIHDDIEPSQQKDSETPSADLETRVSQCQEQLKKMVQLLGMHLESAPDTFVPAIEKFCENLSKTMHQGSQNELISALQKFNPNLRPNENKASVRYMKVPEQDLIATLKALL